MKKKERTIIGIVCLFVVSLSAFALLRLQVGGSEHVRNGKNAVDTKMQATDSARLPDIANAQADSDMQLANLWGMTQGVQVFDSTSPHTVSSDIQRISGFGATQNCGEAGGLLKIQDEQTVNENVSTVWLTDASQGQIPELPVPLPDGRVFLGFLGTEDAIPYIPTQNLRTNDKTPIEPLELDS